MLTSLTLELLDPVIGSQSSDEVDKGAISEYQGTQYQVDEATISKYESTDDQVDQGTVDVIGDLPKRPC